MTEPFDAIQVGFSNARKKRRKERTPSPISLVCISICIGTMSASSATFAAETPPVGAYSCYDARMAFSPIQGSHLEITPTPVAMFGLIDGASYADWDGHKGHYVYDAAQGLLTMTDGSRQGWRYKKIADWSFTLIDNNTGTQIYTCPFETTGDPSHGPW